LAAPVTGNGFSDADAATLVNRQAIISIDALIRPYLRRTPVVWADRADFGLPPGPLVLKLEHLQHTGSFKARGAFANLLQRDVPDAGVVAASGGNHGVAVSYAARTLGVPARIYVPGVSSAAKIARIRDYGAHLVIAGDTYADALAASQEWAVSSGALAVHAFDQAETILGAGTLATELAQQAPAALTVLASVGGGGLLAGIAAGYAGRVRVVERGVDPVVDDVHPGRVQRRVAVEDVRAHAVAHGDHGVRGLVRGALHPGREPVSAAELLGLPRPPRLQRVRGDHVRHPVQHLGQVPGHREPHHAETGERHLHPENSIR